MRTLDDIRKGILLFNYQRPQRKRLNNEKQEKKGCLYTDPNRDDPEAAPEEFRGILTHAKE